MMKFKLYSLEDLFEFKAIKQAKSQKLIPNDPNGIPYIVQSQSDNMVSRYVNKNWLIQHNEPPVKGNAIVLGVTLPAVSYQPYEFGASQVITARSSFLSEHNGLYFVTLLRKQMQYFSYTNKPGLEKYKKLQISLPIDENNNINFKYMEDRVKALEQDRVKALANYLTVTGLNNYELTDSDRKVLSYKPTFKDYKIWDIFKVVNTHSILKSQVTNLSEGKTPYLTAAEGNNAVFSYINCPKEWIDEGNCVFIGGKTMVVTYQEKDFCSNDSHNLALYFKQDKYRTSLIQQYFVGAIRKSLSQKYSWGDSISKSKIKKDIISLPIDKKDNIDFQYMENYIKAVQKLTIKNVVKFKDEVINKTKEIINIKKL